MQLIPEYRLGGYEYIVLTALWDRESEYTENLFYKAYMTAIRTALDLSLHSIVVPAMGYDGHLSASGSALLKVIKDLSGLRNSGEFTLQDIFVVSNNEKHVEYLRQNVEARIYRV